MPTRTYTLRPTSLEYIIDLVNETEPETLGQWLLETHDVADLWYVGGIEAVLKAYMNWHDVQSQ